jgi:hypothetical protein
MGKPSKRPGRAARDVHALIREEAAQLRQAPAFGIRDAAELPAVAELLAAVRRAIESGVPSAVEHHGRRYYVRASLAMQVDVFDAPGAGLPLVSGAAFSTEGFGHAPGH